MSQLVYILPDRRNLDRFVIASAFGRERTKYWNGSKLEDIKDAISFPQRGEAEVEVEKNPAALTLAKYQIIPHLMHSVGEPHTVYVLCRSDGMFSMFNKGNLHLHTSTLGGAHTFNSESDVRTAVTENNLILDE